MRIQIKNKTKLIPDYQAIKDILNPPNNLTEDELISLWLEVTDYELPYEGSTHHPIRIPSVVLTHALLYKNQPSRYFCRSITYDVTYYLQP